MCDKYFGVLYFVPIQAREKEKQYKYILYALYHLSYVTRTTIYETTHPSKVCCGTEISHRRFGNFSNYLLFFRYENNC